MKKGCCILIGGLLLVLTSAIRAQTLTASPDCATTQFACDGTFNLIAGSGVDVDFSYNTISNPTSNPAGYNSGCLLAGEKNPMFFLIHINSTGRLEWIFNDQFGGCYDWIMWPYTASTCSQISAGTLPPVACLWNGICSGTTGMMDSLLPGLSSADFMGGLQVACGETYLLCISNYSEMSGYGQLNFIGSASVNCVPSYGAMQVIGYGDEVCVSDTAMLVAWGAPNLSWSPSTYLNTSSGDTVYANPPNDITYTVIGTGPCGTDTAYVDVIVGTHIPSVTIQQVDTAICKSDSLLLVASVDSMGGTFSWYDHTGTLDFIFTTPGGSNEYIVYYELEGCVGSDTVQINAIPSAAQASTGMTMCDGSSAYLWAHGGVSYNWYPATDLNCTNCNFPLVTPTNGSTTYYVDILDTSGCLHTFQANVIVQDCSGISDPNKELTIRFYPNPTHSDLHVEMSEEHSTAQYSIWNTAGQLMRNGQITESHTVLDLFKLSGGYYILRVETPKSVYVLPFTKF